MNSVTCFSGQRRSGSEVCHRTSYRRIGAYPLKKIGPNRGEAAEGRIGSVELLDLLDRRAAAEASEAADQLQVDEVAGRQRIGVATTEEAEALDGPGTDLRNREQAAVRRPVGGVAAARRRPRRRPRASRRRASARGPSTPVRPAPARRSAPPRGRRAAAPLARRGAAPSGRRCGAGSAPPGPDSISCLTTAQASASQGQGRRRGRRCGRRRISGPSSGSRRKRR